MTDPKLEVFTAADVAHVMRMPTNAEGAAHLNAILAERGQVVYGFHGPEVRHWYTERRAQGWPEPTHQALLLGVRPIVRESAEDVLREIVSFADKVSTSRADLLPLLDRARAVIDRGGR